MADLGDRTKYLGASDMGYVMRGEWYGLFLQKTGREPFPDLSGNLAVHLGIATEALNIRWFCERTGNTLDPQSPDEWTHKRLPFLRCHPDASLLNRELVEAKFCGAFNKEDEILARYYPQCQAQLAIVGAKAVHLSVITGSPSWDSYRIEPDAAYIAELESRAAQFWRYVETDTAPPDQPAAVATIAIDQMREVDMTGNNEWASWAEDWLETKSAAKKFETAAKSIKGLIEPDVKRAHGHGINATKAKNGSITIKELAV